MNLTRLVHRLDRVALTWEGESVWAPPPRERESELNYCMQWRTTEWTGQQW